MIDRVIAMTVSTPKVDRLALAVMTFWLAVIAARIAGQLLGGV